MNNYEFWENYLYEVKENIKKLENKNKNVKIDLHIHSNYSTDGKQTLGEIILDTQQKGFDIIAITDHDNVNVYDELYEIIKNGKRIKPIIIPGIEFTVENNEYGSQCHILQYMINPKKDEFLNNVRKSLNAYYYRCTKQFVRLEQNEALKRVFKKYNIKIKEDEYLKYMCKQFNKIPDYASLCAYLTEKLLSNGSDVLEVFTELEKENKNDKCKERQRLKESRYKILREKYKNDSQSYKSSRLLLSILGVKGVDDDYFKEYAPCGSISVNCYNQLKIEELNTLYPTVFAHPTEGKIDILDKIVKLNNAFIGIEDNIKNEYLEKNKLYNMSRKLNFVVTKGSDRHYDDNSYNDLHFFEISKEELKKIREVLDGKN